jgi:hypothetical protein
LQLLQNHHESERDFRKALSLDDARREGREIPAYSYWPQALIYSDRVRYVEQLRRYEAVFAREQILPLIYDDFRSDNEATVRKVLRFLEVDDTLPVQVMDVHAAVRVRSPRVRTIARRLVVPTQMRRDVRRRVVFGKPQPPDEELVRELRRRFRGEVVALSEYLDRDLVALWGYDDVG